MRTRLVFLIVLIVLVGATALPVGVAMNDRPAQADGSTMAIKADDWQALMDLRSPEPLASEGLQGITSNHVLFPEEEGSYVVGVHEFDNLVRVKDATELTGALRSVRPGDLIVLSPGRYDGNFELSQSGKASAPIGLVGPRTAVVSASDRFDGSALTTSGSHLVVAGFTLEASQTGVWVRSGDDVELAGLEVRDVGSSAVEVGARASNITVTDSFIHDVERSSGDTGNAIHVALGNDPSFGPINVTRNVIGPNVAGTAVVVDDRHSSGVISDNTFLQVSGLGGPSWIDVAGRGFEVTSNRGLISVFHPSVVQSGWQFVAAPDSPEESNTLFTQASRTSGPTLVPSGVGGSATLWLPERSMPYTLSELAARYPTVATRHGEEIHLHASLFASSGAGLVLSGRDATAIRLRSDDSGHVAVVGFDAALAFSGEPGSKLVVSSWDSDDSQVDEVRDDGRGFVLAIGGRMDAEHTIFEYLGYEEGTVSGVAWKGLGGESQHRVAGDVTDSVFRHNYFGAYTFEAIGMEWTHNQFVENDSYGFDPHDFSNEFVFEHNSAVGNGSHGIIFSRGCSGNVIRHNYSANNDGHGIMIDDGRHDPGSTNERHLRPVPSDDNLLAHNVVVGNLDGIVLEGGVGNEVRSNTISGSHRYGIRLKDAVNDSLISGNEVEAADRSLLYIYNGSHDNTIDGNEFGIAPLGLVITESTGNEVTDNTFGHLDQSALVLEEAAGSVISSNVFVGYGSNDIVSDSASDLQSQHLLEVNDFSEWRFPAPFGVQALGMSVWALTLAVPLFFAMAGRAYYDIAGVKQPRGRHLRASTHALIHARRRVVVRESSATLKGQAARSPAGP